MPLSRDLCEEMARAVPEERDRPRLMEGDRYYCPGNDRLEVISVAVRPWTMEGRPIIWCPSLPELLAMSHQRATYAEDVCLFRCMPEGSREYAWAFGEWDGPSDTCCANTPEEAVARWLIAQAKGGAA